MPRILQSMAVAAKVTERNVYICIMYYVYDGAAVKIPQLIHVERYSDGQSVATKSYDFLSFGF